MEALAHEISLLVHELRRAREQRQHEFDWLKSHAGLATRQDLSELGNIIMSAISDFAGRQNVFNEALDVAVEGLTADITGLKELITKLQTSPGTITPEDQALLDAMDARTAAVLAKLQALDDLTPPVVPAA